MAAERKVCEYVRHVSRPFIFSASMTPASVACARAALKILKREPERVQRLTGLSVFMRKALIKEGVPIMHEDGITPIIPIYTYTNRRTFTACKKLFERGVYVNSTVSPAVPEGQSLLRTSYMATHKEEQLSRAAHIIKEVLEEVKDIED